MSDSKDTGQPPTGLSPDDWELFREAVKGIKPLKSEPRVIAASPRPPALPRQRENDERAVLRELLEDPGDEEGLETGEELLFLRSGFQKRFLSRLRRGRYAVGDVLDLHGMNEAVAGETLRRFVDHAVYRGLGCVRIIHGKGLRSRGLPKLKLLTRRLLRKHPAVIAFASCRAAHGGTGAVDVLLKRPT